MEFALAHRRLTSVYSKELVFMYVIVDSCLWYIFRLLAHTLVRTRTIPNSNGDFSQSDQTIFYTVSLNFHFAGFLWTSVVYLC
jgi:hypothetical protein